MIVEDGDPRERAQDLFRRAGPISAFSVHAAALGGACGFLIAAFGLEQIEPIVCMAVDWVYAGGDDIEMLANRIDLGDRSVSRALAVLLHTTIGQIAVAGVSHRETAEMIPVVLRQLTPS